MSTPTIDEAMIQEVRRTLVDAHDLRERVIWWKALIRKASSGLFEALLQDLHQIGTEEFDYSRVTNVEHLAGMTDRERVTFVQGAIVFARLVQLTLEELTGVSLVELLEKADEHRHDQERAVACVVAATEACSDDPTARVERDDFVSNSPVHGSTSTQRRQEAVDGDPGEGQ